MKPPTKQQVIAIKLAIGGATLLALLSYTWLHTGGLLAHYVQPGWAGYVAAFGIELSVVSLSLQIGERKGRGGFFYGVLVAVVVVSAIANIAEGFRIEQGKPLTLASVQELDLLQAVIGLAATGLVSLIVLAMAELWGGEARAMLAEEQGQAAALPAWVPEPLPATVPAIAIEEAQQPQQEEAPPVAPPAIVRQPKAQGTGRAQVWALLNENPSISNSAIVETLSISASSVRAYRAAWNKQRHEQGRSLAMAAD